MNFYEAETYLLSLGNEVETMKLGLENITTLLAALGDPQKNYLKVQVAGTNGKGSVCAFLNAICLRGGVRTGLYTSPHLVSITERIKIDGEEIPEREFAVHASRVRATAESLVAEGKLESVPTFFEHVTATALVAFAEAGVDLAILETGLGGRYDATTAAAADIAAITRIDLDHQEYLGETVEQIAAEKAAIIRPGSRVVLLHQQRQVEQVLIGRCREVGVEPVWATQNFQIKRDPTMKPWLIATFHTERDDYCDALFMSMLGEHQIENASVAIAIAETIGPLGFDIDRDAVVYGIEDTRHPGRLEFAGDFLLDGAHNVGGAEALAAYLEEFVDRPITMVFGAMRDKDVEQIANILWPKANTLILTQPSNPRAMSPRELVELAPESIDVKRVLLAGSAEEVIRVATEVSSGNIVVVTGSLYLVGEVKRLLAETADSSSQI